ncbi:hypothetical protein ACFFNY_35125 [Paenibacillus hodogayensis]|uniref:Uncharacterized protein n=1 Tax=Paenibacillus hodogayensis TaxID=279208 RepID=A0ABV5W8C4_9BACL
MKMKKKLAALALAGALTITSASSAFALSGWADTKATAQPLTLGSSTFQVLSSGADEDWYSYTNTTGSSINLVLELYSPSGLNYDYDYTMSFIPGYVFPVGDLGPGAVDAAAIGSLPAGETVWFRVHGHTPSDYNPAVAYTAWLHTY